MSRRDLICTDCMLNMTRIGAVTWVLLAMATLPSARGDGGFTERDYRKAQLEFNQRTLGRSYEQIGRRDAKWDDDAMQFLGAMAVRFSNARAVSMTRLPGEKSTAE